MTEPDCPANYCACDGGDCASEYGYTPEDDNVVGTCGNCGGQMLQRMCTAFIDRDSGEAYPVIECSECHAGGERGPHGLVLKADTNCGCQCDCGR